MKFTELLEISKKLRLSGSLSANGPTNGSRGKIAPQVNQLACLHLASTPSPPITIWLEVIGSLAEVIDRKAEVIGGLAKMNRS